MKHNSIQKRNSIFLRFPKAKMEVIIMSDGSADATDDIVKKIIRETECVKKGFLKIYSQNRSFGNPFCINAGVKAATGDIIVFADCRQRFSDNAIRELVKNFVDQKVGCVSGELVFEQTPGSSIQSEMGAYWRFEKWLRKLGSTTGSVPGATGAIYAIRRKFFRPLPVQTLLDDVLVPMHVCMLGYRTIFENRAIAYDIVSNNLDLEKKRKVRTLAGNWQLLFLEPALLNPLKNPLWIRFMSHKIFRLLIPYCFITLIFVAFVLKDAYSYIFLVSVALFLLISALPPMSGPFRPIFKLTRISRSIVFLNYFAFLAPLKLALNPRKLW